MNKFFFAIAAAALGVAFLARPVDGAGATATPRLRVMTFNIRYSKAPDGDNGWEFRKAFAVERIRAADPDLLGIQEGLQDQVDYLKQQLNDYRMVGVGRDDGATKGEYSAIFMKTARFNVADSGTFWLSETPTAVGSKSWDAALPRIVSWAKLTTRDKPEVSFIYLNSHWDHMGKLARLESAKLMRKWTSEHAKDMPVIVTGDFNCKEPSEPYKVILRGDGTDPAWIDGYREVHPKVEPDEASFNGFKDVKAGQRIDYILHTRHFKTTDAQIDRTHREKLFPSDHYPVVATLEYRGNP